MYFRMSHAGTCPRKISLEYTGHEFLPPDFLMTAAAEGHLHEKAVKELLRTEKNIITDEQMEIKLEYDNYSFLGHIDGVIKLCDNGVFSEPKLLEIKSMSQGEYNRWIKGNFSEFPQYAIQLSLYMTALNMREAFYVVKNRNTGQVDKRFIPKPLMDLTPVIDKFNAIERAVSEGHTIEADFNPDSLECRRCQAKFFCIKADAKDVSVIINETECKTALNDFRLGQKCLDEGERLINSAKATFKKNLNNGRLNFGPITAAEIKVKRQSYDNKELEKIFGKESLIPALKVTEYTQFRVWDNERYE